MQYAKCVFITGLISNTASDISGA